VAGRAWQWSGRRIVQRGLVRFPDSAAPGKGQFLVYEAEDGRIKIDVRLDEEKPWLP